MDPLAGWAFVTRWGNAVLLLPVASCVGAGLWWTGERAIAWRWVACFGAALVLVVGSKLAFLGWGLGIASLDFTGISGHSMLAAAVLPMFAWWTTQERPQAVQRSAVIAALSLALIVGVSRVVLSTHSASEVIAGLLLGATVARFAIPRDQVGPNGSVFRWIVLGALLIVGAMPGPGASDEAHGLIVRAALALSGRQTPYDRSMLLQSKGDGRLLRSHATMTAS